MQGIRRTGLMPEVPETLCGLKQATLFLCISAHLLHDEGDYVPNCLLKM